MSRHPPPGGFPGGRREFDDEPTRPRLVQVRVAITSWMVFGWVVCVWTLGMNFGLVILRVFVEGLR